MNFLGRAAKRRVTISYKKVIKYLHKGQKELLDNVLENKKKYFALMAHRRYGKDFISLLIMILAAIQHPGNYYIYAPYFRQVKEIVVDGKTLNGLPLLENLIPDEILANPRGPKVNKSDWSVTLFNGAKIFFRGGDNPDASVGVGARGVIYTEAALIKEKFYQYMKPAVDMVINNTDFGFVIFISTPRGKYNWFTKLFIDYFTILSKPENKEIKDMWYVDIQSGKDSLNYKGERVINDKELRKQALTMDPDSYAQEWECKINTHLVGAWYGEQLKKAYEDERIKSYGRYEELLDSVSRRYTQIYTGHFWTQQPLYVAWDIGKRDHTVLWFFQKNPHNNRIRFIKHYRVTGQGPDHCCQYIKKWCKDNGYYMQPTMVLPHDGDVEEWSATSKRSDYIRLNYFSDVRTLSKTELAKNDMTTLINQINYIRKEFENVEIDNNECNIGVIQLGGYVKKYNKSMNCYLDIPDHDANDKASDDADSFRTAMIFASIYLKDSFDGPLTTYY